MKTSLKYIVGLTLVVSFVSCQKNSRPNYQYMPNMYQSVGYETYSESNAFEDGVESQLPPEGAIPRGDHMPFEIENSTEGYELAKKTLFSPLDTIQKNSLKGGQLFDIYCAICHGKKGNGQGTLVKNEKILGVPSYDDAGRAITQGSIYHTIYYGKNAMGSYANQLNEVERWQVVNYVLELKKELGGSDASEETTATADADNPDAVKEDAETETPATEEK